MKNVLTNLEIEIKNLKKDIEGISNSINIFDNDLLEEETLFETQIELDKKQKLYKKIKNFKMITRDDSENIDFLRIKDNKKDIEYSLFYFKATTNFSILMYEGDKITNITKDKYTNSYIMNSKKEGEEKYRTYTKIGKDKQNTYETLLELYKLMRDTK